MPELRGDSDAGWAVWGGSNSGTGLVGTAGSGVGTFGESTNSYGVWGRSTSTAGVVGDTTAGDHTPAVWGHNRGNGDGVAGTAGVDGRGVSGQGGTGVYASGTGYGLFASSPSRAVVGYGGVGVFGFAGPRGTGVFGTIDPDAGGKGGVFSGGVDVSGDLTVINGNKPFKIDHPLDPQNRYLLHNAVESSERKNVYDGVAQLDKDGAAWVDLPEWFEALNGDLRYQLTAVGGPAPNLHVAEEMSGNRFKIAGGGAGMTVCWQVTGARKDPWAAANPFEVEQEKPQEERGRYLQPDLYGAPEEQRIMIGPEAMTGPEEERLRPLMRQGLSQPPQFPLPMGVEPPQAPAMPLGSSAPGFGRLEERNRRQIDELRQQIEELRRQR